MEFAMGLKLSSKKEKSPQSIRQRGGSCGQASEHMEKKSSILTEVILRPALSIFMCMARAVATQWKDRLKHFALFAIFTRAAAPHRFSLRLQQRRSMTF